MSWEATAWAKKTRGHRDISDKLVIMVLADYAHPETWDAWPSQAALAADTEISPRTVIRCLQSLEAEGFITRTRKGNQHQTSIYHLHRNVYVSASSGAKIGEPAVAHAQIGVSDIRASDTVTHTDVNVTPVSPASSVSPQTPLPSPLPPPEQDKERKERAEDGSKEKTESSSSGSNNHYPEWFHELRRFRGCRVTPETALAWAAKRGVSETALTLTVIDMRAALVWNERKQRYEYTDSNGVTRAYSDPYAVLQKWATRPRFGGEQNAGAKSGRDVSEDTAPTGAIDPWTFKPV